MKNLLTLIIGLVAVLLNTAQAKIEALWSTDYALPGEKVVLLLQQVHTSNAGPSRIRQVSTGKIKNAHFLQNRNMRDNYYEESIQDSNGNTIGRIEAYMILVEVGGSGKVECENIEVTFSTGNKETVTVPELPVYTTAKVEWRNIAYPCRLYLPSRFRSSNLSLFPLMPPKGMKTEIISGLY